MLSIVEFGTIRFYGNKIKRRCLFCRKEIFLWPKQIRVGEGKFCSISCSNKGRTGKLSRRWKGKMVGYHGLHLWVKKELGHPKYCEYCRTKGKFLMKDNGIKYWNIQWANKTGKYLRKLTDWIALCAPCHKKYDAN